MRTLTIFAMSLATVFVGNPAFANTPGLLAKLAQCSPEYFQLLKTYEKTLAAHGVKTISKGNVVRVMPPDSMDIAYAHAAAKPAITIDGIAVSGFIDGFVKDEVDGSASYVWGVSTLDSVDNAARAINALLPPGRTAEEVHDNVYVRSDELLLTSAPQTWKAAAPLRYGRLPKNGVLKGLIVEWVPSIDNDPPEGRTWITCDLYGKHIPAGLLATERPDIGRKSKR